MDKTSFSTIKRHLRFVFFWVACFSLVINVLMLTCSIYMMQVFDRVLVSSSLSTLIYLTVIALGALLIMGLIDLVRAKTLITGSTWMERKLAPPVLRRLIEQPQLRAEHRAEPVRDIGTLRSYLSGSGMMYLFDAPWIPVYLAVIYVLHPLLGHVALAGAIILFLLALANDRLSHVLIKETGQAATKSMRLVETGLRNAEVIDAMGLVTGFLRRWAGSAGLAITQQTIASNRAAAITAAAKVLRQVIQITVLGVGAWLVVQQDLTNGAMIAGSIILGRALAPVEQAIGTWRQTVQALEANKRLHMFFNRPTSRPDSMPLPVPHGKLLAENLVYTLPGTNKLLIKGVSFVLSPGEALAIVGPSAAGKSTLARLLVGVLKPTNGTVRLDGGDVYLWNREDFGRYLGYLPQDIEMFDGTIRDNIARFGTAKPEAIVEAAQLAHCHEMVLRLEQGYETEIGDTGVRLSGGQRQRIGLARALFGRPALIVLDEPNASLDFEGEAALNRAIAAMKANGSTVIVIGHRPSTLAQVDKVLVLVNGTVEQFGPRQEVLESLTRRSIQPVPGAAMAKPRLASEAAHSGF